MRITIILAILAFSLAISLFSCDVAYAQDTDIGQSRIHPAHPLYFLKTIREGLELKFAGTPRVRMLRELEFATRRLREVNSLIASHNPALIPATLERYSSNISSLPDLNLNNTELIITIKDSLVIHLSILEKIYHQITDSPAKRVIRTTINRLMLRADIPDYARLPACHFLAKEASSSALNEVEGAIYLQRSQQCFDKLGNGF